jgi:hypothetical protein
VQRVEREGEVVSSEQPDHEASQATRGGSAFLRLTRGASAIATLAVPLR